MCNILNAIIIHSMCTYTTLSIVIMLPFPAKHASLPVRNNAGCFFIWNSFTYSPVFSVNFIISGMQWNELLIYLINCSHRIQSLVRQLIELLPTFLMPMCLPVYNVWRIYNLMMSITRLHINRSLAPSEINVK